MRGNRVDEQLVRAPHALLPRWVEGRALLHPRNVVCCAVVDVVDLRVGRRSRIVLERLYNPAKCGVSSVIEIKRVWRMSNSWRLVQVHE